MEGIPRVPMFSLELLSPDKPFPSKFEESIREYIVVTYQDDHTKYSHAFKELESLRNVIMQNVANVESICILKRYFAQLSMMKARFPLEEGDSLAVPFSWIDRGFDLSAAVTYNDVNFELCCVLFNIGASHALVAANETRSDVDSIKNAFMHFQYASWPMQHLRDSMRSSNFSGMNFSHSFLTFYVDMFLAQAQECILEKSMVDGRKPLVIAKVTKQLKTYYESNLSLLSILATELTSIGRYKALFRLCSAKMELYDAIACYYLGVQAEKEQDMGLRVSYYMYALERINVASKIVSKDDRESLRQAIQFAHDVISQKEENARKENDFIYHAKITKPQDFDVVEGVVMVKPIGFDINDPSVCGEDLFAALLPTDVLKTVSLYSEKKVTFKREIVEKVQAKDSELENYLISLQLNQLHLDEPIDSVRLPDELLSSSAAFTSQPSAFPSLIDKFDDITRMASDAERKLDGLIVRVKAVQTPELVYDDGFKTINAKVEELNSHHMKARENNIELQRAIAAHSENLKLLAMPLIHITKEICGEYIDPMEHAEGQRLRMVLDKVDEMRRQRCKLLQTLDEDFDADDITKKALADRDFHPQELFERELKKHEKLVSVINQNLVAQDNILSALTEANANFAEFRRRIIEANEKRSLHSLTLVTAYQVFRDVVEKTDKAIAFYKQLFSMIDALSKGIAIVEETEEKKRKEDERLAAEKRMAQESAEALQEFRLAPNSSRSSAKRSDLTSTLSAISAAKNGTVTSKPAATERPRLGDYMDYYRNKVAASQPRNGGGTSTPEYSFRPISTASISSGYSSLQGPNTTPVVPQITTPMACPPVPGSYSIAQPVNHSQQSATFHFNATVQSPQVSSSYVAVQLSQPPSMPMQCPPISAHVAAQQSNQSLPILAQTPFNVHTSMQSSQVSSHYSAGQLFPTSNGAYVDPNSVLPTAQLPATARLNTSVQPPESIGYLSGPTSAPSSTLMQCMSTGANVGSRPVNDLQPILPPANLYSAASGHPWMSSNIPSFAAHVPTNTGAQIMNSQQFVAPTASTSQPAVFNTTGVAPMGHNQLAQHPGMGMPGITSSDFSTLSNQQQAISSQATVPAAFPAMGITNFTPRTVPSAASPWHRNMDPLNPYATYPNSQNRFM